MLISFLTSTCVINLNKYCSLPEPDVAGPSLEHFRFMEGSIYLNSYYNSKFLSSTLLSAFKIHFPLYASSFLSSFSDSNLLYFLLQVLDLPFMLLTLYLLLLAVFFLFLRYSSNVKPHFNEILFKNFVSVINLIRTLPTIFKTLEKILSK